MSFPTAKYRLGPYIYPYVEVNDSCYKIDRWQKLIAQAKQVREQPTVNSHQSSVSSDQLKVNSPKGYPHSRATRS